MSSKNNFSLQEFISTYKNEEAYNNYIFDLFTKQTNEHEFLKSHRDHIEKFNLGYGERAFLYMWYLIIKDIEKNQLPALMLEIGVFKGQVISLWKLISQNIEFNLNIKGITPLSGKKKPNKLMSMLLFKFSKKFREDLAAGNFYSETDYRETIETLFKDFNLSLSNVELIKGYSTEQLVIDQVKDKMFSVIYIDGDHSYDTVIQDIKNYSPLIVKNGFMIMDDASYYLPGTVFWKGHESVSRACDIIENLGFTNVLNIGHNRVYQKV